jgi:two-component system, response regulator, stage 0 sporulation protein F
MHTAILLVDDEPSVLAIFRRVMQDLVEEYELITVADGATALALIAERPVALVITDQRMPDMDGVALIEAIKAVAPECPVVLMTGYPAPEVRQRARAVGADFFLSKPFPFNELEAIVRASLAQ